MGLPSAGMHKHAVQFYGSDHSLFTTVAQFLGEGLIDRQPAIVIATLPHRAAIEEHLCGRLIDCAKARRNGDLLMLDAEDTLGQFLVGDEPDEDLFNESIGKIVKQTLEGRGSVTVRAYGEMVDVLWKQGRTSAAITLEMFWNKLVAQYGFALLCGYSMGHFFKQPKHLDTVREQHTHVVGSDNVVPFVLNRRR